MLLPVASLFVACKDKDGYNLDNLNADYAKIETENKNIKVVKNEIRFDYSNYENLQTTIDNEERYSILHDYNYIFDNLMKFSYKYLEICSNNSISADADVKNRVNTTLKDLKSSIREVDACVDMFGEILEVCEDNIYEVACVVRYENLLETYDEMFQSAINFNNALSDLYFGSVLKDANPNVLKYELENFDASIVVNKLESRLVYQMSALTQSYVEMYIDGGSLAEKIAQGEINFEINAFDYQSNIEAINKSIEEQVASERANNVSNKQRFYDLAVQAYNIQAVLKNDKEKFVYACNAISYSKVKGSDVASANEKLCVTIIDGNYDLISTYNSVLVEMLSLMGV